MGNPINGSDPFGLARNKFIKTTGGISWGGGSGGFVGGGRSSGGWSWNGGGAKSIRSVQSPGSRGGGSCRARQAAKNIPGSVKSRINIQNKPNMRYDLTKESGWEHVVERHFSPGKNAGQFTISQTEVKALLQSKQVVNAPVRVSEVSGQFIREVDIGKTIGTVKPSLGGQATSKLMVITNEAGNLVTTYPIQ